MAKRPAEKVAVAKNATTHKTTTTANDNQCTDPKPSAAPTPAIAPTMHCVVHTGRPMEDAVLTMSDAAKFAELPRLGLISTSLNPIVFITL
jgi:hypothetical protein